MHSTKRRLFVLLGLSFLMTIFVPTVIHELESNPSFRADNIKAGMTRSQVCQILGKPNRTSHTPLFPAAEDWHYDGSRRFRVKFSLHPFRISVPRPDNWITIGFTNEQVRSVWIPSTA